ncbi:hypothetical protein HMPREF9371_1675 [Neisseria shayeganii 871]|uniref:Uncharacterized protein n=1 Tax=Neisseria shayeganii 871 TaxID=1032488 RepID=G4CJ86_9NEIS|nr:hypothetical protein HMPREF9371_1675 [Neisseria shayeganii 871]
MTHLYSRSCRPAAPNCVFKALFSFGIRKKRFHDIVLRAFSGKKIYAGNIDQNVIFS